MAIFYKALDVGIYYVTNMLLLKVFHRTFYGTFYGIDNISDGRTE
jgi:hypothetical protein